MTVGAPTAHKDVREFDEEEEELQPMNIDPNIWKPS
jgi:hypothetical protein